MSLLLAASSCSPAAPEGSRSARPVLHWDDPAPAREGAAVVYRFDLPPQASAWGDQHARPQLLAEGSDWSVGVWRGGGRLQLSLPSDLAEFDSVVLTGRFGAGHRVDLTLTGELYREHWIANTSAQQGRDAREVVLACTGRNPRGARPSQLTLVVVGPDCAIAQVELARRPLADVLPEPEHGSTVRLGDDERVASGLGAARGLAAELEGRVGDTLEFAYGRWPGAASRTVACELVLELQTPHGTLERRLTLEPGERWQSARIELQGELRDTRRVRFELDVAPGVRAAVALADLWLGRRDRQAPTVLLITSDTHRGDHLGTAEFGVEVDTPTLDGLAARGVVFSDCYSATNITVPSHASVFTGLSPQQTRLLSNHERLAPRAVTLGEAFRSGGYRTLGVISARHLSLAEGNVGQGFDRLQLASGPQDAEQAVGDLLAMLDQAAGQPAFLWLHLFDAHTPYGPPDRPSDGEPLPGEDEASRELYRAEVNYLDRQLARLLEHPRVRAGVVAFTSDHGEVMDLPGENFMHNLPLPGTLHVPLILAWPGAPQGALVSTPVETVDLGRTLLDLGGLQALEFPGRSLLGVIQAAQPSAQPRFALGELGRYASVTAGDDFLLLQLGERSSQAMALGRHGVALFDRAADRSARRDLAAERPARVRELRAQLIEWLAQPRTVSLGEASNLTPERIERLRALGYSGEESTPVDERWIDPACECAQCASLRDPPGG